MLDDRFWSKVVKTSPEGCWLWSANMNNKGYGLFRPGGTVPKQLAHRVSYEAAFGKIPNGGIILHSCDNRICVNPAHLRVGTFKENTADMYSRDRGISGEKHPNCRIRVEDVLEMRSRAKTEPHSLIAADFSISRRHASDVIAGRRWGHIV